MTHGLTLNPSPKRHSPLLPLPNRRPVPNPIARRNGRPWRCSSFSTTVMGPTPPAPVPKLTGVCERQTPRSHADYRNEKINLGAIDHASFASAITAASRS